MRAAAAQEEGAYLKKRVRRAGGARCTVSLTRSRSARASINNPERGERTRSRTLGTGPHSALSSRVASPLAIARPQITRRPAAAPAVNRDPSSRVQSINSTAYNSTHSPISSVLWRLKQLRPVASSRHSLELLSAKPRELSLQQCT